MAYKNKENQRAAAAKHYQTNKQKMKDKALANNKLIRERSRKYIKDYLSTHPCVDCGNDNVIVLEFDHVRDTKLYNISDMVQKAYSITTIQKEIDKCDVRCANCHRIATYNRRSGPGETRTLMQPITLSTGYEPEEILVQEPEIEIPSLL